MAVVTGQPNPFQPGLALQDGTALNKFLANDSSSYASGLVATGTNLGSALQLAAVYNKFATVGNGTGCNLPTANAGATCTIDVRAAANSLQVYASQTSPTDTIDGTAGTTGVPLGVARGSIFCVCYVQGAWSTYVNGAASS